MIIERRPVGVVVERRPSSNRWEPWVWRAVGVLPGAPETPPWTVLGEAGGATTYYAGTAELVLYEKETETYKPNVEGGTPSVYVVLRKAETVSGYELLLATVDVGEAQAHADSGDDLLEAVPMPDPVRSWVAGFVATHHVERAFYKRKRDRADPEALATGPRRERRGPRGPEELDD